MQGISVGMWESRWDARNQGGNAGNQGCNARNGGGNAGTIIEIESL